MRQALKISLWIAAIVALAGSGYFYVERDTAVPPAYAVAEISRGEVVATVSATGTLNPVVTVQVGSQVSGTIHRLNADFNSRVRKGELIAQIEPSLFRAQVAQAEANLQSAEATRDKAKVSIRDAKHQVDRLLQLKVQNAVSESDVDAARFAYEAATVEERVKAAAIAQMQAALEQARVNLEHTHIYAPIDGVVISRDVDVGQTVAASLQAPTLFTIAQDLTRMQIETEVDEAFIGAIREGQPVTFTVFAYPKRVFHGRVTQVRLNPKVDAGVVLYNCIIHVENPDLALKPGMTATVTIEVERRDHVFKAPNTALRYVPELPPEQLGKLRKHLKRGEAVIWLAGSEGLSPLKVKRGLAGESETEISAAQLREGMKIAVPPEKRGDRPRARRHGLRLF